MFWSEISVRKKVILVFFGVMVLICLGVFGWQVKSGKFLPRLKTVAGQSFSDVPPSYWAYSQIEAANHAGIIQGYPDSTFRPEQVVTRDQAAAFLSRALAGSDANVKVAPTATVLNSSFENNVSGYTQLPANWSVPIWGGSQWMLRVTSKAFIGSASLRFLNNYSPISVASQSDSIAVSPNTTYALSGYIFIASGSGGAYFDLSDIPEECHAYTNATAGRGSWRRVSCSFKTGAATTSVRIRAVTDRAYGSIYYDAVQLDLGSSITDYQSPFNDVPSSYWAYKYIQYLQIKSIILPALNYNPTTNMTRDQMATLLARALAGVDSKVPAGPTTPTFKDVPTTYWAYKYIEYLAKMGIISGYPDGTFHPTENLTRAQAASFMSKAFIPVIIADPATNISFNSATLNGNLTSLGYDQITERGFYLYSSNDCTGSVVRNPKVTGPNATLGKYNADVFQLSPDSIYSYKAYSKTPLEGISACQSFKTLKAVPTLSTLDASNLQINGSTLNGNITSIGITQPTERGFYLYNGKSCGGTIIQYPKQKSGPYNSGTYSIDVRDLAQDTDYSYRAYAINTAGKGTGDCRFFHTRILKGWKSSVLGHSSSLISKDQAFDGSQSLKMVFYSNGQDYSYQDTPSYLKNGNKYTISAYVFRKNGANAVPILWVHDTQNVNQVFSSGGKLSISGKD